MTKRYFPYPSPSFAKQVTEVNLPPLATVASGEITATASGIPLSPVPNVSGKIVDVYLTVGASGKDDSATLTISGEVKINGTSCLTTMPTISHVSGESSQQKTTVLTGDTGITQAVIDTDNNSFNPGDSITADFILERTASPTTEMQNPCIVVELDPDS